MATIKYTDIEIQTAKNLLKEGYKWIARNSFGTLFTYGVKQVNNPEKYMSGRYVCSCFVPIFESVKRDDKEPVSLESIVHPQVLDDAEKRYLKGVIRPFRNDVTKIYKGGFWPYVFLKFNLKFNGEKYFFLNNCYTVTMFTGMEPNRWYTLEELGL